jgi:hypothetical protein
MELEVRTYFIRFGDGLDSSEQRIFSYRVRDGFLGSLSRDNQKKDILSQG